MKEQNDIPHWVYDSHIKFHFQTKDIRSHINWPYFNAIRRMVLVATEVVTGKKLNRPITIAPLHSLTAKTCIEQSGQEYSIIFDCNYGSTIKKLYNSVVNKSSIPDLHRFLKEIIAIRIFYQGKDALALALKDEPVSLLYNRNYFNLVTELTTAQGFYRAVPQNPTIEVNQFIDFYIQAGGQYSRYGIGRALCLSHKDSVVR